MADELKSLYDRTTVCHFLATTVLCAYTLYTGLVTAHYYPPRLTTDGYNVDHILCVVWHLTGYLFYMMICAYYWSTRHTTLHMTLSHMGAQMIFSVYATVLVHRGYVPLNPVVIVPIAAYACMFHLRGLFKRLRKLKKQ